MRAVILPGHGGPEVLSLEEVEDPDVGVGDVLVRLEGVGLNHLDLDIRAGVARIELELPVILGSEGVGRIERVSPEAAGQWREGDRVMVAEEIPCGRCEVCVVGRQNLCMQGSWLGSTRPGCYAELIAVPADAVIALPEERPATDWAAVQAAFGTAWHMLITRGGLRAGERVLVNAAGSGIGSAAVQIAKYAGATVLATAGSEPKLARARELGADLTFDYSDAGWSDAVLEATKGAGVDLVYDHVGGDVFVKSLDLTRPGGRIATCGAHAGETVPLDIIELFRAERTIIGSRCYTRSESETVIELVAAGHLDPVVDSVIALDEIPEGHRRLEARAAFGKVVVTPQRLASGAPTAGPDVQANHE